MSCTVASQNLVGGKCFTFSEDQFIKFKKWNFPGSFTEICSQKHEGPASQAFSEALLGRWQWCACQKPLQVGNAWQRGDWVGTPNRVAYRPLEETTLESSKTDKGQEGAVKRAPGLPLQVFGSEPEAWGPVGLCPPVSSPCSLLLPGFEVGSY